MRIEEYWIEKNHLIEKEFDGWNKGDEIDVRKYILMTILSIPENGLPYYLNRERTYASFALDSLTCINHDALSKEYIINKANEIISKFFYKNDYIYLCKLIHDSVEKEVYTKNDVCEGIKKAILKDTYEKISKEEQKKVLLLEKIYFEPIELFNEYIKDESGRKVFYTILMEQWKTANEMAANISSQRNNMNNFYISLMSILIGGIMFSDQLLNSNVLAKTVLFITIAITGFICCQKWIAQIVNYGKLNSAKYDVINELERQLPANVMLSEYERTEKNARKEKNKINFSEQEKGIAKLFRIIVIVVPLIMLIGTWWEIIWKNLSK